MPTMFTLPWRWTTVPRPERTVVFASRFDAGGLKARWILFGAGIRLRRAVLTAPGALGVGLRAHPLRGRYYTLSMWQDEASLLAFAQGVDHQAAVARITEVGAINGVLVSRDADSSRPRWKATLRWLNAATPGPYRIEPSPAAP